MGMAERTAFYIYKYCKDHRLRHYATRLQIEKLNKYFGTDYSPGQLKRGVMLLKEKGLIEPISKRNYKIYIEKEFPYPVGGEDGVGL